MFQRKSVLGANVAPLQGYGIIVDYCACMMSITLATHMVDASNVNIQWSAGQLSVLLNSQSPLSKSPNFYIDSIALMHGFLLIRRDLVRRGISIIEMYQKDKFIPVCHHLKYLRVRLDIKFSAYYTPPTSEVDLLIY